MTSRPKPLFSGSFHRGFAYLGAFLRLAWRMSLMSITYIPSALFLPFTPRTIPPNVLKFQPFPLHRFLSFPSVISFFPFQSFPFYFSLRERVMQDQESMECMWAGWRSGLALHSSEGALRGCRVPLQVRIRHSGSLPGQDTGRSSPSLHSGALPSHAPLELRSFFVFFFSLCYPDYRQMCDSCR